MSAHHEMSQAQREAVIGELLEMARLAKAAHRGFHRDMLETRAALGWRDSRWKAGVTFGFKLQFRDLRKRIQLLRRISEECREDRARRLFGRSLVAHARRTMAADS